MLARSLFQQCPAVNCRRLNKTESDQYISCMPSKRLPSPKDVIKVRSRRQYQVGDEVMVPARVTRVGKLGAAEAVTVELRIGQKVTANPEYLFGDADDA